MVNGPVMLDKALMEGNETEHSGGIVFVNCPQSWVSKDGYPSHDQFLNFVELDIHCRAQGPSGLFVLSHIRVASP